jgi:DNA-binding beta-propeller fold protein YncE
MLRPHTFVWILVLFPLGGCTDTGGRASSVPLLAVSHSALNRISFFDITRHEVIGAVPTEKLPHDMLLSPDDDTLYVINSGAQCISTYYLHQPEFWKYAKAFLHSDSTHIVSHPSHASGHSAIRATGNDTSGVRETMLNPDPVQHLSSLIARHFLTDTLFPERAAQPHALAGALTHTSCFDCHDRSVGAKPFAPVFSKDQASIYMVQLSYRTITEMDAKTLSIRRTIVLDVPERYSPVEVWMHPDGTHALVTCRNEIGQSLPGTILVVDLASGKTQKSVTAGIYPWHIVPDASDSLLYINNFQSSTVSVFDLRSESIVDSIVVRNGPSMMLINPHKHLLYVSCFYTDNVIAVNTDTRKVAAIFDVDTNPTSLLLSSDGSHLTVLCGGESSLNIIDLETGRVSETYPLMFGAYAFKLIHIPSSLLL